MLHTIEVPINANMIQAEGVTSNDYRDQPTQAEEMKKCNEIHLAKLLHYFIPFNPFFFVQILLLLSNSCPFYSFTNE